MISEKMIILFLKKEPMHMQREPFQYVVFL